MEEVISQLSTPFVTEISQDLDTTGNEMIDRLKLEYVVTTFRTDVNHTLLELFANYSLMAFVSNIEEIFPGIVKTISMVLFSEFRKDSLS